MADRYSASHANAIGIYGRVSRWIVSILLFLFSVVLILLAAAFSFALLDLPGGLVSQDRNGVIKAEGEGFTQPEMDLTLLSSSSIERKGRRVLTLLSPISYLHVDAEGTSEVVESIPIPRYFSTDFASIPSQLHWLINPFGRHAEPAVLHDWLYAVGSKNQRLYADRLFYRAMQLENVPVWRRRLIYTAVRLWPMIPGVENPYGRLSEWEDAFILPYLHLQLPTDVCVWPKPTSFRRQYYQDRNKVPEKRVEGEPLRDTIVYAESRSKLENSLLKSYTYSDWRYFDLEWMSHLSSEKCQERVYSILFSSTKQQWSDSYLLDDLDQWAQFQLSKDLGLEVAKRNCGLTRKFISDMSNYAEAERMQSFGYSPDPMATEYLTQECDLFNYQVTDEIR